MTTKYVNRTQFLEEFKTAEINDVPGIEGTVIIRELSADERIEITAPMAMYATGEGADFEAGIPQLMAKFPLIVSFGMKRPDLTLKQIKQIPGSKADAITYIAAEILKLSGLWAEDEPDPNAES